MVERVHDVERIHGGYGARDALGRDLGAFDDLDSGLSAVERRAVDRGAVERGAVERRAGSAAARVQSRACDDS